MSGMNLVRGHHTFKQSTLIWTCTELYLSQILYPQAAGWHSDVSNMIEAANHAKRIQKHNCYHQSSTLTILISDVHLLAITASAISLLRFADTFNTLLYDIAP